MKKHGDSTLLSEIEDANGIIINNNWTKINKNFYKRFSLKNNKIKQLIKYKKLKCEYCKKYFLMSIHTIFHKKENLYLCSNECRCYYNTKEQNILNKKHLPEFYSLLGWISSDGYLKNNCNNVTISIQISDKNILNKIQKIFKGKIYFEKLSKYSKKEKAAWTINNKNTYDFLLSIGITPKKSFSINIDSYFNSLTYDQKCSIIRGIIEGDGWIRIDKNNHFDFGLCSSSINFITTIYNFIKNEILFKKYKYNSKIKIQDKSRKNVHYAFRFTIKNHVQSILKEIYNPSLNNSLYLDRKYNVAKQICTEI